MDDPAKSSAGKSPREGPPLNNLQPSSCLPRPKTRRLRNYPRQTPDPGPGVLRSPAAPDSGRETRTARPQHRPSRSAPGSNQTSCGECSLRNFRRRHTAHCFSGDAERTVKHCPGTLINCFVYDLPRNPVVSRGIIPGPGTPEGKKQVRF